MAPQPTGSTSRRRRPAFTQPGATEPTRHPAVAVAMALPCAVLLAVLFGGWEQMADQAHTVAELIGH
ncbi:hypothetical protein [Kitasatospora sp. NPDC015120]|uniref:hypothetical protein n=1 Tax=Kitasatospora sp. NPDC015120 TaxID=3364023 RepID=UPI0036F47C14